MPECLLSLELIDAPKVWIKNYTELQLEAIIPWVIHESDYDNYVVVSDDVIASTDAFRAVCNGLSRFQVVTGYCNLDLTSGFVSLTSAPPQEPYGQAETYVWRTFDQVPKEEYIRTWHPSFAMTGMSREMWEEFPWKCFGFLGSAGWAADLSLSIRLHAAEIPIWAPRAAFMYHTKREWKEIDTKHAGRELLIGKEQPKVVWDV